jgi:alpha-galactosidase
MKKVLSSPAFPLFNLCLAFLISVTVSAQLPSKPILADKPPMGWNSFVSYGVYLHEKAAMDNLEAFIVKLKPAGYEYFVIDSGWYGEFKLKPGTLFPAEKHATNVNINEYGLLQPSVTYFPNGLKLLIDKCHQNSLKFGIHLMRGIPRKAVLENTQIQGTSYRARDIADTASICVWNLQNFGVDMTKPGAQEFYNSLINQMAEWGVDFIKYDDIVPYPAEVKAVVNAISQAKRPIVLSLSPGDKVNEDAVNIYKKANMLRVTSDIWDRQKDIDVCFKAWRKWQGKEQPGFWIDMDMIPFGQLQLMSPKPNVLTGKESRSEIIEYQKQGKLTNIELLSGLGWNRCSDLTKDQMYTFITMRALAVSPLMMGGDLPTLDEFSLELLTNSKMIMCNQNGVMGKLVYEKDGIEVWKTMRENSPDGWFGVFNRTDEKKEYIISADLLSLQNLSDYLLYDIWSNTTINEMNNVIPPHGVFFVEFSKIK